MPARCHLCDRWRGQLRTRSHFLFLLSRALNHYRMWALVQIRFLDREQQKHPAYIRADLPDKRGQVISTTYTGNKGMTPSCS